MSEAADENTVIINNYVALPEFATASLTATLVLPDDWVITIKELTIKVIKAIITASN